MIQPFLVGQNNLTWKSAFEISLIYNDSFRDDFLRSEYWPSEYIVRADDNASIEELLKIENFKRIVDHYARSFYLSCRQDPRLHMIVYRDDEQNSKPVGMALFTLPHYFPVPKPSLLYRLQTWLLSIKFKVQDWLTFGTIWNPLHSRAEDRCYTNAAQQLNAQDSKERVKYLDSLSRDERAKESYPRSLTYYLKLFGVLKSEQGKRLGKNMINTLIQLIRTQFGIIDPPGGGPAKLSLLSSPAGIEFYKKCGFSLPSQYVETMPSGRTLSHSYFYLNLD